MEYNLILTLFISLFVLGTLTILLFYFENIPAKFIYPAGFTFVFMALIAYYFLPVKSDLFSKVDYHQIAILAGFVIFFVLAELLLSKILHLENSLLKNEQRKKIVLIALFYAFSTLAQEFMFRSFVFDVTKYLFNSIVISILASTLIFAIAHLAYKDKLFFTVSSVFGLAMSILYIFVPNLLAISAVHAIIGSLAILLGFIRVRGKTSLL